MKWLKNKNAQISLALLAGIAIGALFYPTKHIEERERAKYQEIIKMSETIKETLRTKLTEQIDELKEEKTTRIIETVQKVAKLTYQIRELKSKKKETFYKLVKPDGTIEIRTYKESEVNESTKVITSIKEEFESKVTEIEDRWKRVHTKRIKDVKKDFETKKKIYEDRIAELESEKIVDINPKTYGLEAGYLSNANYYMHSNIDVFGPVFIGVHAQTDFAGDFAAGAGVGLRF